MSEEERDVFPMLLCGLLVFGLRASDVGRTRL